MKIQMGYFLTKVHAIIRLNMFYVFQATKSDALSKRDSSVEVDPYAEYYEAYSQQVQPLTQGFITEKQGFAGAMENVFGNDAAVSFSQR